MLPMKPELLQSLRKRWANNPLAQSYLDEVESVQATIMTGSVSTSEETADDQICEEPLIQSEVIKGCAHVAYRLVLTWRGREWVTNEFCPKCGVKL